MESTLMTQDRAVFAYSTRLVSQKERLVSIWGQGWMSKTCAIWLDNFDLEKIINTHNTSLQNTTLYKYFCKGKINASIGELVLVFSSKMWWTLGAE